MMKKLIPLVALLALGLGLYYKYRVAPALNLDALQLTTLNGQPFQPEATTTSKRVVNFFQTWCGPCRAEMPMFAAWQQADPENRQVWCISDEPVERLEIIQQQAGPHIIVLHTAQKMNDIGVHTWPTSYLLDRNNTVIMKHVGQLQRSDLDAQ
ncbi:MAG: TlpA disulfide reductase family protein [Chitinophagales bacterium]